MTVVPNSTFADQFLTTAPAEPEHQTFAATIAETGLVADNLLRLTLRSESFKSWQLTGPDEYVGLLIPRNGQFYGLEIPAGSNARSAVSSLPEESALDLRWYTIRHLDQWSGTLDVDIATHGMTEEDISAASEGTVGPALAWALSVRPGDSLGIYTSQALRHREDQRQLLIGDPTAAPSILGILEYTAEFHPEQLRDLHVILIGNSLLDFEPGIDEQWRDELGSLHLLIAPIEAHAQVIASKLQNLRLDSHPASSVSYLWVSGEGDMVKRARSCAIDSWGLDSQKVFWCPFWFIGRPRP